MIRIGIDPGVTGAIAILDANGHFSEVIDMPTMADGKKKQVNGAEFAKIMIGFPKGTQVFLEKTQVMARKRGGTEISQGTVSMFTSGTNYGILQGVLLGQFIPFHLVTPQQWKKAAGLIGKEKDMARTLAQQLYPEAPLGKKAHIGRADALLIARFG